MCLDNTVPHTHHHCHTTTLLLVQVSEMCVLERTRIRKYEADMAAAAAEKAAVERAQMAEELDRALKSEAAATAAAKAAQEKARLVGVTKRCIVRRVLGCVCVSGRRCRERDVQEERHREGM